MLSIKIQKRKSVFITGGTSGIGEALALKYAKDSLVGICGRSREKYEKSRVFNHPNIRFYQVDVLSSEYDDVINQFINQNSLNIFIANAGVGVRKKQDFADVKKHIEVVDVNVLGFLHSISKPLEYFQQQKIGHLVGLCSLSALMGLPGNPSYCAAKAFVKVYLEALTMDLKHKNIAVTSVMPGYIDTPLTKGNNHKMPFLMNVDLAAEKIIKAVNKKKEYIHFPKTFSIPVHLLASLPRGLRHFLLNKFVKYS